MNPAKILLIIAFGHGAILSRRWDVMRRLYEGTSVIRSRRLASGSHGLMRLRPDTACGLLTRGPMQLHENETLMFLRGYGDEINRSLSVLIRNHPIHGIHEPFAHVPRNLQAKIYKLNLYDLLHPLEPR